MGCIHIHCKGEYVMADIPKAREILFEALEYKMDSEARTRINFALEHMYRVYENGKAPTKSRKMTKELATKAIELRDEFPHMSQQEIANALRLNIGRVSEALSGKYNDKY